MYYIFLILRNFSEFMVHDMRRRPDFDHIEEFNGNDKPYFGQKKKIFFFNFLSTYLKNAYVGIRVSSQEYNTSQGKKYVRCKSHRRLYSNLEDVLV